MTLEKVNNQLIPRMIRHGFPLTGIHFDWDYSEDYSPEQQKAYEEMILNNYEVDPAYFQEKYNMPVGERRTVPSVAIPSQPQEDNHKQQQRNASHTGGGREGASPFFD